MPYNHYFQAITNRTGDSLVGYFVRVINTVSGNTVPLYADLNGTPIVTVSGVADMAKTDENGNVSFYNDAGTYHLDIYQPDATTFILRVPNVAMQSGQGPQGDPGPTGEVGASDSAFPTLAALKAIDPVLYPSPRLAAASGADGGVPNGLFTYQTAGAPYTADNVNVIKLDAVPLSTGALVRQGAQGILYDAAQSVKGKLDRIGYITDARFAGGAKGDNTADDSAAIQAAIDYFEGIGGGEVRVPEGTFKTTVAPVLKGKVSLVGNGPASIIRSNVCHGLVIAKSDEIAPRRVANLRFYGNGGENFSAIYADVAFPDRVQGLVFENVFADFFGTIIRGRGFWHTAFKSIRANQCRRGVWLYNRDVKITIDDCSFIRGGAIVNTEDSVGMQIGDEDASFRPEDVQVTNSIFFGFDIGVRVRQALFGGIVNCDIDACTSKGAEIITADGGYTIDDNWFDVLEGTGAKYGFHALPLGYDPGPINISITNNRVRVPASQTTEAEAAGMLVEQNQSNMLVMGNSFTGTAAIAIRAEGATSARVERCEFIANKASGQARFFNMAACSIDKNTFDGGIILSGNVNMAIGKNHGLHTTEIIGSVDIPAGQTSVTATWLSLNMPDLPLGGYAISCVGTDRGTLTHGGLAIVPTRTGITVTGQNALGAASTVDFHLRVY